MSQHPEIEAKIVEELDSLELLVTPTRPRPRSVEYADLAKLDYLQCVVKVMYHCDCPWNLNPSAVDILTWAVPNTDVMLWIIILRLFSSSGAHLAFCTHE